MGRCLLGGRAPGADNANITMPFDETDVKQAGCGIVADDKLTLFELGMVWVGENPGKRVREHSDCIGECDAMLAKVGSGFALIPFELHTQQFSRVPAQSLTWKPAARGR